MLAVDRLLQSHPAHANGEQEPAAVQAARRSALDLFSKVGFPNTKVEEWKYTSTKALQETGFVVETCDPSPIAKPIEVEWGENAAAQLVFINGQLHRDWSHWPSQEGVSIDELAQAEGPLLQTTADPFSSLNLAFVQDAVHIQIGANVVVDGPIHLLFIGQATDTPICSHPRVVISAQSSAQATVIQTHMGQGEAPAWINAVVHTYVAANATVRHHLIHQGGDTLQYVGNIRADVERDGSYHSHTYWLGGSYARNDLSVSLNGPGAGVDLYGLYLSGNAEHLDNHTVVEHRVPHCRSNELYKGILAGTAKAVFNGRIVVHKDAQKTDSQQSNRNLLLSEKATINTKPELEIYADDVSCAHGTTVGQMDEAALFYLQSRGISRSKAKVMLTEAFCVELLDLIPNETLRSRLQNAVIERLAAITQDTP